MNIRSLTRGDGAVIGAAVLLFIASFLDYFSADCDGSFCDKIEMPNAWDTEKLQLILPTVFLTGIIGAALLIIGRFLPEGRKFGAVTLPQFGTSLLVVSLWSAVWAMIVAPDQASMGAGAIIALIASLIGAVAALISPTVPALSAPLMPAAGPRPGPYGGPQQAGYGYPGAPQQGGYGYPGAPQGGQPGPYGGQPVQGGQPQDAQSHGGPQGAAAGAPDPNFQPFWFAVPMARPLFPEDGSPQPIAELAPGTWYLAVEQRGQALVAQTQDGRRGILQDTSNIQRG
ncbi:DUF5336 domain-containing protein [Streptomyces albus]|uniref:DUF5336 domain-containing protein n=1 Tax=Streptomyces albus TaxID=1888 RepID=UPI0006E39118|nr:DUF5336 domain-containing protein [Streptomyces albus]